MSKRRESSQEKTRGAIVRAGGLLLCLLVGSVLLSRSTVETEAPTVWVHEQMVSPSPPRVTSTTMPTVTPVPSATDTPVRPTATLPTKTPPATPTSPLPTVTPTPSRVPASSLPARIVIPVIDLDAPVVEVGWNLVERNGQLSTEWEVADFAVGFHKGSAYPGNVGNTVLSGHHNIRGEVFRDLHMVEPGDNIYLYVGIQGYHYIVEAKYRFPEKGMPPEVQRDNARWIQQTADERLTLVTCWPYSGNSHRIVVVAKPGS